MKSGTGEGEKRRQYRPGTWQVARLLTSILDPAARARGFTEASLLAEWGSIVGPGLAGRCQPIAVRFERGRRGGGVLLLEAGSGAALELQHAAPQLIERVNRYFGTTAIRSLRFVPRPLWAPPRRPAVIADPPLDQVARAALEETVRPVADAGLKSALTRLGDAVHRRARRHAAPPGTAGACDPPAPPLAPQK
jgi:hypothetical protein